MSWTNQTKTTGSWDNKGKSDVAPAGVFDTGEFDETKFDTTVTQIPEWTNAIKLGREWTMAELEDYKFTDTGITADGRKLSEVTFDELAAPSWTNQPKS